MLMDRPQVGEVETAYGSTLHQPHCYRFTFDALQRRRVLYGELVAEDAKIRRIAVDAVGHSAACGDETDEYRDRI